MTIEIYYDYLLYTMYSLFFKEERNEKKEHTFRKLWKIF